MSTSITSRKPPQRAIGLLDINATTGDFLVEIAVQHAANRVQVDYYICREIPADFGTAFRLEKQAVEASDPTEVYHVCLQAANDHICDCRGAGKWGHCKHSEGLVALIRAGRLTPSKPLPVRQPVTWGDPSDADCPVPGADDI